MATVKVTASQQSMLFEELGARRDDGTLRFVLRGEGKVVGTNDELALVARKLEMSRVVAEVTGNKKRAGGLRRILNRFEQAGITPAAPSEKPQEGVTGSGRPQVAPESSFLGRGPEKPVHHAKRNRVWFEVETLRRGSAQGRGATKKAWSKKSKPRASEQRGMIRGDKVFTRGQGMPGLVMGGTYQGPMEPTIDRSARPNEERTAWMTAGRTAEERRASREATKQGRAVKVKRSQAQETTERVDRAISRLKRKGRRVRPFEVASVLLAEDVKAGKYARGSAPHAACKARYKRIAEKQLAQYARPVEVGDRAAAAKLDPNRNAPRVQRAAAHTHKWAVTPQRTKRTCAGCGRVERKRNGRWQQWFPKGRLPMVDGVEKRLPR